MFTQRKLDGNDHDAANGDVPVPSGAESPSFDGFDRCVIQNFTSRCSVTRRPDWPCRSSPPSRERVPFLPTRTSWRSVDISDERSVTPRHWTWFELRHERPAGFFLNGPEPSPVKTCVRRAGSRLLPGRQRSKTRGRTSTAAPQPWFSSQGGGACGTPLWSGLVPLRCPWRGYPEEFAVSKAGEAVVAAAVARRPRVSRPVEQSRAVSAQPEPVSAGWAAVASVAPGAWAGAWGSGSGGGGAGVSNEGDLDRGRRFFHVERKMHETHEHEKEDVQHHGPRPESQEGRLLLESIHGSDVVHDPTFFSSFLTRSSWPPSSMYLRY